MTRPIANTAVQGFTRLSDSIMMGYTYVYVLNAFCYRDDLLSVVNVFPHAAYACVLAGSTCGRGYQPGKKRKKEKKRVKTLNSLVNKGIYLAWTNISTPVRILAMWPCGDHSSSIQY